LDQLFIAFVIADMSRGYFVLCRVAFCGLFLGLLKGTGYLVLDWKKRDLRCKLAIAIGTRICFFPS
jgi:hypothetical protein